MKRMKVPDYKDKNVFGVPLIVHVQRSGQPLPLSLQQALRYLRSQCLDQVSHSTADTLSLSLTEALLTTAPSHRIGHNLHVSQMQGCSEARDSPFCTHTVILSCNINTDVL